jgi:predicted metal-dependent hydrolase
LYSKEFDDIPITFFKSTRAKRIIIRVKPIEGVRVSVPLYASYNSAEKFVLSRINWIKENQEKFLAQQSHDRIFNIGDTYATKQHLIFLLSHTEHEIRIIKELNKVSIFIPNNFDAKQPDIQEKIRKEVIEIWRIEAKEYLPIRLDYLAKQNNLLYTKVAIRNTRTRWGSCSYVNNINLSLHLMRLPEKLIDYVILHELAHTKVKNHSRDFWSYLESICEDSKALDRQLKKYNTRFL